MLEMQLRVLTLEARVTKSVACRPGLFSPLDVDQHTSAAKYATLSTHSVGYLSDSQTTPIPFPDCVWSRRTCSVVALPPPRPSAQDRTFSKPVACL
jgi:hypothetical protein